MHFDPDKDDSIADEVYLLIERAIDEQRHALAAILSSTFCAIHENRTRELAEAVRPFAEGCLAGAVLEIAGERE